MADGAMTYKPTIRERFWRALGFRYHLTRPARRHRQEAAGLDDDEVAHPFFVWRSATAASYRPSRFRPSAGNKRCGGRGEFGAQFSYRCTRRQTVIKKARQIMAQVNRSLADPNMDDIDHALGRPKDPLGETYRNHYAADASSPTARRMSSSPYWINSGRNSGTLKIFSVSQQGKQALADYLTK